MMNRAVNYCGRRYQFGQSIAEFLVALTVLVPLFMAVTYAGRYADLQQTATQASRYAAFQRALEPNSVRLSDEVLADQMRARFFADINYLNMGRLQSDDSLTKFPKNKGQPALWNDLSGAPLLTELDKKVTLTWADISLGGTTVSKPLNYMAKTTAGKDYPGGKVARVEVSLMNKLNLAETSPKPLVIASATAAAGNTLSSSGSKATRDAAATIVPTAYVPDILTGFFEEALDLFEPEGPIIGCIKPDVVAGNRLDGAADNSKCW
jgi:TadE-like protein